MAHKQKQKNVVDWGCLRWTCYTPCGFFRWPFGCCGNTDRLIDGGGFSVRDGGVRRGGRWAAVLYLYVGRRDKGDKMPAVSHFINSGAVASSTLSGWLRVRKSHFNETKSSCMYKR